MIRPTAKFRVLISRAVIGCMLTFLLLRWFSGLLPHQLLSPRLTGRNFDFTQWFLKLTGIAQATVTGGWTSKVFILILSLTGILAFLFPLQRRFVWPFTMLFFVLAVVTNIYLTHNAHYLAGAVWLSFCLWPKRDENFEILWEGARYYTCFVYAAAALWKVWGGAALQWDNGFLVAKANLSGYLFLNPETSMAQVYYWFFDHPWLLNLGQKVILLAEGILIVGFFTKKYDGWLIGLLFFIHLGTYLFADVFFAELLILALPLLSLHFWKRIWERTVPSAAQIYSKC